MTQFWVLFISIPLLVWLTFLIFVICLVVLVCRVSNKPAHSQNRPTLKVSRSRNMKQKIYEILTSPKIQMNGVILNNCIDYVCLCCGRLLVLDLSTMQVLHTQYVTTFQDRKTNLFFGRSFGMAILFRDLLTFTLSGTFKGTPRRPRDHSCNI